MSGWQRLRVVQWQEVAGWPLHRRAAVCAVAAVVGFALPWAVLTRPAAARAAALAVRADAVRVQLAGIERQRADVPAVPVASTASSASGAPNGTTGIAHQVATLAQKAQAHGLSGGQFRPQPEDIRIGAYQGLPVALRVAGTWPQLAAFVADLATPVPGVSASLHGVSVRAQPPAAAPDGGRNAQPVLELRAQVYLWQLAADAADFAIPPAATATTQAGPVPAVASWPRNPFALVEIPASAQPRQALEQVPLAALTWVGTLETERGRSGLLLTPDGQLHRVYPGTRIGPHQGRVSAVQRNRIAVIEHVPDGNGGWRERPASVELNPHR